VIRQWNGIGLVVIAVVISIFTFGCAGTKGSYSPITSVSEGTDFAKYTNVVVEVNNSPDVALTASDKERILAQIIATIKKEYPNRFKDINPAKPDDLTMQAIINMTKYDKGNAFARFMLAGLGAMHINADILLNDLSTKQCLGKTECNKTFAWGGLYGGSTRIEDIEEGFAKAVAASIVEAKK
jgi:hypothetical protein